MCVQKVRIGVYAVLTQGECMMGVSYITDHCESFQAPGQFGSKWEERVYIWFAASAKVNNSIQHMLCRLVNNMLLPVILLSADILRLGKAIKHKVGSYNYKDQEHYSVKHNMQ